MRQSINPERRVEIKNIPEREVRALLDLAIAYRSERGRMPVDAGKQMQRMRTVMEIFGKLGFEGAKEAHVPSGMTIDRRILKGDLSPEMVQLTTDLRQELGKLYPSFMHDFVESKGLLASQDQTDAEEAARRAAFVAEAGQLKAAADERTRTDIAVQAVREQAIRSAEVGDSEARGRVLRLVEYYLDARHAGDTRAQQNAFGDSVDHLFGGSTTVHHDANSRVDQDLVKALSLIKDPQKYDWSFLGAEGRDAITSGVLVNFLRAYARSLKADGRPVPKILDEI